MHKTYTFAAVAVVPVVRVVRRRSPSFAETDFLAMTQSCVVFQAFQTASYFALFIREYIALKM